MGLKARKPSGFANNTSRDQPAQVFSRQCPYNHAGYGHIPQVQIYLNRTPCNQIQCSPFITLCLGSIGMDHVVSEFCYKETILQSNYRKMTILWSFSCAIFHGKFEATSRLLYPNLCYNKMCYKKTPLYI